MSTLEEEAMSWEVRVGADGLVGFGLTGRRRSARSGRCQGSASSSRWRKWLVPPLFPSLSLSLTCSTPLLYVYPLQERRDPRFSSLSGTLDPHLHSSSYNFLPDMLNSELSTLQSSLKLARKAVLSAPRSERAEKEAEVERIENELGRVRTRREREARERREREALGGWKREEREKRKEGKGEWHLGDGTYHNRPLASAPEPTRFDASLTSLSLPTTPPSPAPSPAEKKRLLATAKHTALLAQGGQYAVKKSMEKKIKKQDGKEKKSRPRGLGFGGDGGAQGGDRKRVKM